MFYEGKVSKPKKKDSTSFTWTYSTGLHSIWEIEQYRLNHSISISHWSLFNLSHCSKFTNMQHSSMIAYKINWPTLSTLATEFQFHVYKDT
jgi:hypothetical protein